MCLSGRVQTQVRVTYHIHIYNFTQLDLATGKKKEEERLSLVYLKK